MDKDMTRGTPLSNTKANAAYIDGQNALLCAWKMRPASPLPPEARLPGIYSKTGRAYDVCLPREYAAYNLFPGVRDGALEFFHSHGIQWHDAIDGGPSNHLRDSQVQCVNALFPMTSDPGRIAMAFSDVVDIGRVLEIDGRHLTFEFIGEYDLLHEAGRTGSRTRGSQCTSVDAAFLYETSAGVRELALVEWKYTENYLRAAPVDAAKNATRSDRYRAHVEDPDGPIDPTVLAFDLLLDEPFYQLVRQQLLAYLLEKNRELGAEVVRVLHVLPPANVGYERSLPRAEHRALGTTVEEVWRRLLRHPDRFRHVDPVVFLDPAVTSPDYVDRYGG